MRASPFGKLRVPSQSRDWIATPSFLGLAMTNGSVLILIRIAQVRDDFGALNPWVTECTEGGHEDTETNHAYRHLPCSVTSGLASVPSVSKGLALWLRRSRVRKYAG